MQIHCHHRTRVPEQCLETYPEGNACWTAVISAKGRIGHTPHSPKFATMELRPVTKCPLCGNLWPTVQHILNGCPVSLSQERYTWRHDSALKILAQGLGKCLQPGERLFADLPEMRATDNPPATIPAEILDTLARPDIVIVGDGEITLIELTVPYNSPDCLNWLPHTHSALRQQIPSLSKSTATQLLDLAAKAIVTASHRIFCARLNPTWN